MRSFEKERCKRHFETECNLAPWEKFVFCLFFMLFFLQNHAKTVENFAVKCKKGIQNHWF